MKPVGSVSAKNFRSSSPISTPAQPKITARLVIASRPDDETVELAAFEPGAQIARRDGVGQRSGLHAEKYPLAGSEVAPRDRQPEPAETLERSEAS